MKCVVEKKLRDSTYSGINRIMTVELMATVKIIPVRRIQRNGHQTNSDSVTEEILERKEVSEETDKGQKG